MSGAGQRSEEDMKRTRESMEDGPFVHVLVMGSAGPIEQEEVGTFGYEQGHESDIDDRNEKGEDE